MREDNIHQNKVVKLKNLIPEEIDAYLERCANHVACVVGFGSNIKAALKTDFPVIWVDIPVSGNNAVYEVWTSSKPVTQFRCELIDGAGNEDIFFGRISASFVSSEDLSEAAQLAYSRIFDFLQHSNYPNLLRVWNYLPNINFIEAGIERYRSFSVGRHEAFARYNIKVEDAPSACALGSFSGPLVIYFLASRTPGVQIENPRQTSAYKYPRQYGPRSPTFSRATLAFEGGAQTLFISGTASILGHVTVHPGFVEMQARETLDNIRAVIDQASKEGFKFAGFGEGIALKAYVRHAEHFSIVRDIIHEEYGVIEELVMLQADICRVDLLLEIEAVCWSSTGY